MKVERRAVRGNLLPSSVPGLGGDRDSAPPGELGEDGGGCLVGWEECLKSQFGDRDIDCGAEVGQCGQQPKFAVTGAKPQWDSESQVIRPWLVRVVGHQFRKLGDQVVQDGRIKTDYQFIEG